VEGTPRALQPDGSFAQSISASDLSFSEEETDYYNRSMSEHYRYSRSFQDSETFENSMSFKRKKPNGKEESKRERKRSSNKDKPTHKKGLRVHVINHKKIIFGAMLGSGRFGRTFKATYKSRIFVVKRSYISGVPWKQSFLDEIKRLVKIPPHPNIANIVGVVVPTHKIDPLLCFDFIEGGSLATPVYTTREFPIERVPPLVRDIAQGMKHLHMYGMIHQLLAARNVLLDGQGRAVICDFGLLEITSKHQQKKKKSKSLAYMRWLAPEVLKGKKPTKASDVWSFGCLLYELVARKIPYHEIGNDDQVITKIIEGQRLEAPHNTPEDITICEEYLINTLLVRSFVPVFTVVLDRFFVFTESSFENLFVKI